MGRNCKVSNRYDGLDDKKSSAIPSNGLIVEAEAEAEADVGAAPTASIDLVLNDDGGTGAGTAAAVSEGGVCRPGGQGGGDG